MRKILYEVNRSQMNAKNKRSDEYNKDNQLLGRNRYERRVHSKLGTSVNQLNRLDMNKLFKDDILDINLEVHGETDDYVVRISFSGFLNELHKQLQRTQQEINLKDITRALTKAFNGENVFVRCSCPDFCLVEDTKIKLLNGEVFAIKDILPKFENGEELWVYSTDEKGDFKPGKVSNVWISGYENDFIKIVLDNDREIITTPNHRYMLRNGDYCEAKDLKIGTSLMPMYFSYHNGYENYKKNSDVSATKFFSVYKEVANECLQDKIEEAKIRSQEDSIVIHHSDFNKLNNYPSNLIPMGVIEHWKYHYNHVFESGVFDKWQEAGRKYWSTEEAKQKQSKVMSEGISNWWKNMSPEEYVFNCNRIKEQNNRPEILEKFSNSQKQIWKNYSEEEYKIRCEINKQSNAKCKEKRQIGVSNSWKSCTEEEYKNRCEADSLGVKNAWKNHSEKFMTQKRLNMYKNTEVQKKRLLTRVLNIFKKLLDNNEPLTEELYDKYRIAEHGPKWQNYFDSFDICKSELGINHTIKNIECIHYDESVPVYDLQVDKYENFLVDAGVILHNCYRQAYWLSKNNAIAGEKEDRPSDITNPHDTKGSGCKHIMIALANTSWLIRTGNVIRNYILYMEKHYPKLYADIIYPAIYEKDYEEPVQQELIDHDNDLRTNDYTDIVDTANKWSRTRGQFQKGNEYRFRPNDDIEGQQEFDFDSLFNEPVDDTEDTTEGDL